MAFTEKPPMLQGSEKEQLRAIRDYLFRMANSLETAASAPVVVSSSALTQAQNGVMVPGGKSSKPVDVHDLQKNAQELKALIIKHAKDLQNQIDNIDPINFFVKYADDFDGDYPPIMFNAPKDTTAYLGVSYSYESTAPTSTADYRWSKLAGKDGTKGEPGPVGKAGLVTYLHIKYSDDGESFTTNPLSGAADGETIGAYIGMYNDYFEQDSMLFGDYEWHKFGDDTELKSLVENNSLLISHMEREIEDFKGEYLAVSEFGAWEKTLTTTIEKSAKGVLEQYGLQETTIGTMNQNIDSYFTEINGEIRRGFLPDPDNPGNYIFGIAISSKLKFSNTTQNKDGYTYYELLGDQTFGLYTSQGWQFWVDGQKRGYFDSTDQKLHVRDIVADYSLRIGDDWQLKSYPDSHELEIVYVGGGGS